jgi:LuxR family maltose regulon positive regulatory protein
MERRLDDAEAALAAGEQDQDLARTWADTDDLRTAPATIPVYRASLAQARGDVDGTVRHARRALSLAGPGDHFIRGAAGGYLGLAAWAAGNIVEALDTFGSAVRNLHAAGNLVDELDATVVLADLWLASGRPSRARKLYEQALRKATGSGEPFPRATADLHVGLAELDRELDDLASAEAHLESARVLGERASITENRHRWYVAMALLRAATGNDDAALHLLDEAEALYRRGFYPDVRPIAAMKARLQIAAGDLASAAEWAHERRVSVADVPEYLHEYEHLTLVRLLIAAHRTGHTIEHPGSDSPVAAALDLLDKLHAAAADAGRDGSLLEIRVLQALANHANGDVPRALVTVERALVEAPEPERYVRLYLDEGAPMHALIHEVATERGDSTPVHVRRLLERAAAPAAGFERRQPLVDPLSQRELEVLRLLDSELSGPEVARQLYVSLNTLRTHTKRIFTKLDVTNRAAAVRRGRELGLL